MPCQTPRAGGKSGGGSPEVRERPLQHPLQDCRSCSSRGSGRAAVSSHAMVSSTLLGRQIDLLPGEAVKQVCRARREGNIAAGLQKMSQLEGWRRQSIWMEKTLIPWAIWRSTLPGWGMQPYPGTPTLLQDRHNGWEQSCPGLALPKSIPGLCCICPLLPSPAWSCLFDHSIPDSGPFFIGKEIPPQ